MDFPNNRLIRGIKGAPDKRAVSLVVIEKTDIREPGMIGVRLIKGVFVATALAVDVHGLCRLTNQGNRRPAAGGVSVLTAGLGPKGLTLRHAKRMSGMKRPEHCVRATANQTKRSNNIFQNFELQKDRLNQGKRAGRIIGEDVDVGLACTNVMAVDLGRFTQCSNELIFQVHKAI
ncbi:MAG: hypothetical protein ABI569_16695 [Casimicrobiaceae bacterium]